MGHFPPITQCLHGTDATAAFACCFGLGREGLGWGCEGLGCGCEGLASSCHLLASFFMCLANAFASHVCPDLSTITLSSMKCNRFSIADITSSYAGPGSSAIDAGIEDIQATCSGHYYVSPPANYGPHGDFTASVSLRHCGLLLGMWWST